MRYEKPAFVEIKMDAEIGSYQNDFDPIEFVGLVELARPQSEDASDAE